MDAIQAANEAPDKENSINLEPAESDEAKSIASNLKIENATDIIQFGTSVQSKAAEFANKLLAEVRSNDAGETGNLLTDLLLKVKGLELDEISSEQSFLSKIPLLGDLFDAGKKLIARFDSIEGQIEKIIDELHKARTNLLTDITNMQALYDKNLEAFRELQIYIHAGNLKLKEMRDTVLPEMLEKAKSSGDQMLTQKYNDLTQMTERFEKKIHDLKLTRMHALQTGPQIRLIQNGNQLLVEKIQSSILNTIPLWKNQIVIALGMFRQKKALKAQQAVSQATNDLLQKNAEMLKTNTIEIAKENEKGDIEIETLKKVNSELISTISETIKIQDEGRQKRLSAEKDLVAMETEIKNKLLEAKG